MALCKHLTVVCIKNYSCLEKGDKIGHGHDNEELHSDELQRVTTKGNPTTIKRLKTSETTRIL